ncbi:unnamed protein product, partial [Laminaria digitata]
ARSHVGTTRIHIIVLMINENALFFSWLCDWNLTTVIVQNSSVPALPQEASRKAQAGLFLLWASEKAQLLFLMLSTTSYGVALSFILLPSRLEAVMMSWTQASQRTGSTFLKRLGSAKAEH